MANAAVDLNAPLEAVAGQLAPVVVRVITHPRREETAGGVVAAASRTHRYVLLDALPAELRDRVALAVQAIRAGR